MPNIHLTFTNRSTVLSEDDMRTALMSSPNAEHPPVQAFHAGAGDRLGPYRLDSLLGQGGMSTVYRAIDTRLERPVAIKISDLWFSARLEREARSIAALCHPHVCTLYDVGPNYLVMELVNGETLATRLRRGALSIPEVLHFGAQIADALDAVHRLGITHRDLKPSNIMIEKNGVKVLDFGLAKRASNDLELARLKL